MLNSIIGFEIFFSKLAYCISHSSKTLTRFFQNSSTVSHFLDSLYWMTDDFIFSLNETSSEVGYLTSMIQCKVTTTGNVECINFRRCLADFIKLQSQSVVQRKHVTRQVDRLYGLCKGKHRFPFDHRSYSQLPPCGHLAITNTQLLRTAAKSPANRMLQTFDWNKLPLLRTYRQLIRPHRHNFIVFSLVIADTK